MWQYWTTTVLGLGLVGIAVFGLSSDLYVWAVGIMGAVIAGISLIGAYTVGEKGTEGSARHA